MSLRVPKEDTMEEKIQRVAEQVAAASGKTTDEVLPMIHRALESEWPQPIAQSQIDELRRSTAVMEELAASGRQSAHDWATGEHTRYGIYTLGRFGPEQLGCTSKDGIGTALVRWREEGEITEGTRIGILDGIEGKWIVSPYGNGR